MIKCKLCGGSDGVPGIGHDDDTDCIVSLAARLAAVEARPALSVPPLPVEPAPEKPGRACRWKGIPHRPTVYCTDECADAGRPLNPAPTVPVVEPQRPLPCSRVNCSAMVNYGDTRCGLGHAQDQPPAPPPSAQTVAPAVDVNDVWCPTAGCMLDIGHAMPHRGWRGEFADPPTVEPAASAPAVELECDDLCQRGESPCLNHTVLVVEPAPAVTVSHDEAMAATENLLDPHTSLWRRDTLQRYIREREAAEKDQFNKGWGAGTANARQDATSEIESLRASLATREKEVTTLKGENMCDACAGNGSPISGIPCMCLGSGKMSTAATYLREKLIAADKEVAALREEAKELRRQLTNQSESNHMRNVELDALRYVWCSGGCKGGVHRFAAGEVTEEVVAAAERNTARLRSWFANKANRDARNSNPPCPESQAAQPPVSQGAGTLREMACKVFRCQSVLGVDHCVGCDEMTSALEQAEARGRASALPAGAEEALREWRALTPHCREHFEKLVNFGAGHYGTLGRNVTEVAKRLLRALSTVPGGDGDE